MKIKLTDIKVDFELQSRETINTSVVQDYAEFIREGGKMPPITAFYDGEQYYVADGWHRYFAHKVSAFPEIEANIIEGTRREAILFSLGANDEHGLRRTNADKRKAVNTLLQDIEWSEWNDSEIARKCKVSSMFVGKVRKEVIGEDDVPAQRKVMRGDTEYVMDTGRIGAKLVEKEFPTDYDEKEEKLEEMATEFQAIAQENEDLRAKLAVKVMEGTEEEKKEAQAIIEEQRATIKSLEAQLKGVVASRDAYQLKNAELIKQLNYWKKQVQK